MTYNIGFSISFKNSVIFLLFLTIYLKKDFYPVWTKDQYEVNSYQFLFVVIYKFFLHFNLFLKKPTGSNGSKPGRITYCVVVIICMICVLFGNYNL